MALFRGRLAFMVLVLLAVNFLRWWHGDDEVILAVAAQPGDYDDEFNEHLYHTTWGETTLTSQAQWESEWGSTQLDADNLPAPPEPTALPATSLSSSLAPDTVPHQSEEHGMNVAGQVAGPALSVDDLLDYEDYVERYLRRVEDPEPRAAHGEDALAPPGDSQATVATPVDWEEQESTVDEEEGWIRRNGEWKRGRDRWHNRDGSLKNPPSRQHTWDPTNLWPCSWDDFPPEGATSSSSSWGDTGIEEVPLPEGRPLLSGELTTIDEHDADAPLPSQTRTMDEADQAGGSTYATGFYRNGEWIPRERTPQELRFHTGGQGSVRKAKREESDLWFFVVLVEFWDLTVMFYFHDNWVDLFLCRDHGVDYKHQHLQVELFVFHQLFISFTLLFASHNDNRIDYVFLELFDYELYYLELIGYDLGDFNYEPDYHFLELFDYEPAYIMLFPSLSKDPSVMGTETEDVTFMQLSGSERASLQEAGLREVQMQRLEALMECLDEFQERGLGPESRWGLRCALRRCDGLSELLDRLLGILERRMRVRGFWPVSRVPATDRDCERWWTWARQFSQVVQEAVQGQLQTPLGPPDLDEHLRSHESEGGIESAAGMGWLGRSGGAASSTDRPVIVIPYMRRRRDAPASPARASRSVSRSPRRNPANSEINEDMSGHDSARSASVDLEASSDGEPYSMDSSHALDEHGVLVEVPPQTGPGPFGPPPPQPVNHPLAPTELMGIWREPEEEPGPSTTTLTSITGETLALSSTSTFGDAEADGLELMQESFVLEPGDQWTLTSTSTSTQVMPADIVRNATNNALALCTRADTLELLRRLLRRCRHMQHCSRLLLDAVEEALQWVELPESALPLNAGIADRVVWGEVSRQVAHGSSATPDRPTHWVTDPSVVLQPGLPRDVDELRSALPGIPDHVAAGYRRRAWRLHIHELYRALGRDSPRGNWPAEEDRDLFLVQQSLEQEVDNWPASATRPSLSSVTIAGRRRGRLPRPVPTRMPTQVNPLLEMVDGVQMGMSSAAPTVSLTGTRNRSRSRDAHRDGPGVPRGVLPDGLPSPVGVLSPEAAHSPEEPGSPEDDRRPEGLRSPQVAGSQQDGPDIMLQEGYTSEDTTLSVMNEGAFSTAAASASDLGVVHGAVLRRQPYDVFTGEPPVDEGNFPRRRQVGRYYRRRRVESRNAKFEQSEQ
ncbi:unnamed protein product [Symbiodinium sp. CCMP2592]|nr:unnamed protein product [Symbiodinium sp. CCMP2592]